ncbi:class I mannose-6-phosphate isomerase [Bacteroides salyersiae]|jgi:mannose-6-phosphate isomerase class I|uniref:Mannose-6-phosphate isomerase n=1 Tax=Bacteroides salyersiae TaxID=291644 RepID=A0A7J4XEL4_9BACE|nr:class I mannose-6-phosphate isomerase [Bacteroides salyersiae]KAA3690097.1 mannose-6-phosphate isomerase [Bacteroides salyersiae]KAA3696753.1 mannose-6-phosphate isomerase [Bacteroides salyersiae]KAA3696906.1 mannose-6-phosphate isomerase [Bacteroides salyersiae]KAA3702843.1 mannose-6-phosphate isomerase [Bacteroides salyersiae]KAA3704617.1 mannose-6-phosphate isomerase [Bacteroides salyersiae]
MRKANYDRFPSTKISGTVIQGWENICSLLEEHLKAYPALAVDFYTGVYEEEVINELHRLSPALFIDTRDLMKPESEIKAMTARFMTDDVLFGYVTNITLNDYFDQDKLKKAREEVIATKGKVVVVGSGAAMVVPAEAVLVYADMARWEIQQRFRRHEVKALGIDNRKDAVSLQYKRGYFNDWRVCDKYKESLFDKVDFWLDTHIATEPKMIDQTTFFKGIEETVHSPFRVVPFFDPAPWGGQWMKEVCDLDPEKENYGWCFDCVPEENSLYFEVNGVRFELPSVDLVLLKTRELLGEPVEARFGKDFPIRFDFLDTVGGGNLSVQVHPTTQFIRENFGMYYTQDESYYLLDAKEGATVYLGLKTGIDKNEMIEDLRKAQKGEIVFNTEKYVNKLPAKKHDHYLIPGGTVHCSGSEALVLEISSTPNLFTFKLWDWQRLGLDGKPRPINVERGKKVIDWKRDTEYVKQHLANHLTKISEGDGWREERTGLHPNEFIETRRHWFTKPVTHHTNNSVNVLNLIEGEEAIIESPNGAFKPFVVHYAETFIIPANVNEYIISPYGKSAGKECATIKAYVRF